MQIDERARRAFRVGVMGAGAAGLSAAHALRRAGYERVTVLERDARVGGKCHTIEYAGRTYELGAGAITGAYRNVHELMDECGVADAGGISGLYLDLERGRHSFVPPPLKTRAFWRVGLEGARLFGALLADRRIRQPGLAGIDPALCADFATWARERGVEHAAAMLEPWFTGFGYGYFDEVPAAYVLKYAALFRFPIGELLDTGYQGLWERVARGLDVRLGAEVREVYRPDAGSVRVQTTQGAFEFDGVVLATPLDAAPAFVDLDPDERELCARVRCNEYHVVGVRMTNAPPARYGFVARHFQREHAGQVVFFYRRWLDRDLVLFYTMPPAGTALSQSRAAVFETVARLGGRVEAVHVEHAWRYFPHVTPADMRAGFYDRLEARQGRRRTWIAGEVCSFTAVEPVVAYSRALVARHFASGAPSP